MVSEETRCRHKGYYYSLKRQHFWIWIVFIYITGVGSGGGGGGGKGGMGPPTSLIGVGNGMFVPPPHLTPHFYFPLELYVCITLTNNYLAFFIYQLIILWTISINWHRWLLLNNHTSKYNLFIMVLYRRYINYVSVCPPHFLATSYAIVYIYIYSWLFNSFGGGG